MRYMPEDFAGIDLTDAMMRQLVKDGRHVALQVFGTEDGTLACHATLWSRTDRDGGRETICNPVGDATDVEGAVSDLYAFTFEFPGAPLAKKEPEEHGEG